MLLRFSPLLLLPLCLGCFPTDRAVIQQAQGFDQNIKPAEIRDADINGYFQKIGERIVTAARQSDEAQWGPKTHFSNEKDDWMYQGIQFHLVNSKTLNAFTTGGTHVYIYNELFQLCKTEDELAAVMSHEFGHIYSRHVQKGTQRQYGVIAGALGLGAAGYLAGGQQHGSEYASAGAALGALAGDFLNKGYTRGDEAEADKCGFHFYCLAGWDPAKFGDFFQTMIDKGYDTTPEMASDHPTLASRVKVAHDRAEKMPDLPKPADNLRKPNIASDADFRRYQQQAQRDAQSTPDDKSLANSKLLLAALPRSCWMPVNPPDQRDAHNQLVEQLKQKQAQQPQQK
jgi:predicted Zn-dependent protease